MFKLFKFLNPYKWKLLLILLFLFIQAIVELYLPTLMSDIVNNGMLKGDTNYIWVSGGYMLIAALGSSFFAILGSLLSAQVALAFGRDLRKIVFTRVESYTLNEFDKIGTASLITRNTNDITQIQTFLVMAMRFLIYAPIMCLGGILMALSTDKELTIILAVVLPILLIVIIILAKLVVPLFKLMQKRLDHVNLVLRENLIGIRVIRSFNRVNSEMERFKDSNHQLTDISIKVNKILATMHPIMMFLMNITSVAIIWFAGFRIDEQKLQLGDMMAFLQYAMQIMFSLIMVSMMYVMVPRATASALRINEVLDVLPEINDPKKPSNTPSKKVAVEFKDVTFSYPGAEKPALENISFVANPGQITAIIGGTGSGKSTLISLIPRLYDIDSGNVLVGNTDIRDMLQAELRNKIGFVPQTPILFSGTVIENIRFGKKDATKEELEEAAKISQAYEFITKMDKGFESEISQGGTNISGGQKQRLSIARAVVRRPEIYIFDDSFSALDFKTDANLRKALRPCLLDSTVLIVAQRVSTVMDADQIIVLDEGKVAGIGKHKDLYENCLVYREIVLSQLSKEEIK